MIAFAIGTLIAATVFLSAVAGTLAGMRDDKEPAPIGALSIAISASLLVVMSVTCAVLVLSGAP